MQGGISYAVGCEGDVRRKMTLGPSTGMEQAGAVQVQSMLQPRDANLLLNLARHEVVVRREAVPGTWQRKNSCQLLTAIMRASTSTKAETYIR